jgi:uncharacterized UPF0160 family protein
MAIAILVRAYGRAISVVRTRDPELIAAANIVVDVGGVHNIGKRRFDHHQRGFSFTRPDGTPYASAGLVWREYAADFGLTEEVAQKIDYSLIAPIDCWDTGDRDCGTMMPLSVAISLMNATDVFDDAAQAVAFDGAVAFCGAILDGKIRQEQEVVRLGRIYQQARLEAARDKSEVVTLPEFIPNVVNRLASDAPSVRFVLFPAGEEWRVQGTPGNLLPEEWRGLDRDALAATSGIEDIVFVHPAGFIGGARTVESATKMALLAVFGEA